MLYIQREKIVSMSLTLLLFSQALPAQERSSYTSLTQKNKTFFAIKA